MITILSKNNLIIDSVSPKHKKKQLRPFVYNESKNTTYQLLVESCQQSRAHKPSTSRHSPRIPSTNSPPHSTHCYWCCRRACPSESSHTRHKQSNRHGRYCPSPGKPRGGPLLTWNTCSMYCTPFAAAPFLSLITIGRRFRS